MSDFKTTMTRAAMDAARLSGAAQLARSLVSPFGAIFTLHHVSPEPPRSFEPNAHLRIRPEFLDRVLTLLKQRGVELVSLAEAVLRIQSVSAVPTRRSQGFFAAFTLDDGYRNTAEHAAPVFRRHGVPYAVFVSPGFCEGRVLPWWETIETIVRNGSSARLDGGESLACDSLSAKRRVFDRLASMLSGMPDPCRIDAIVRRLAEMNAVAPEPEPRSALMTYEEVATLSRDPLCTIGAHSMTHPVLARLDAAAVLRQIEASRTAIETHVGRRADFFAYPFGSVDACGPREYALARQAGFCAAFTTRLHPLTRGTVRDMFALPRLSLNGYYQDEAYLDVFLSGLPGLWKHRGERHPIPVPTGS